jgi:hypothetical protein
MSGYRYRAERLTPIGTDPCNTMARGTRPSADPLKASLMTPSVVGPGKLFETVDFIPRSGENPKIRGVDDPEVVGDLVAELTPIPGHGVAQEVQDGCLELCKVGVAFVVGGVLVH